MPNSLQSSAIASPASRRATNCSLSSITEHSFQGIIPSPLRGESVTYVSGTMCYLCLRPLTPGEKLIGGSLDRYLVHVTQCALTALAGLDNKIIRNISSFVGSGVEALGQGKCLSLLSQVPLPKS